MQDKLVAALHPTEIRIDDQSHLHAGHAGAKSGKGHFDLHIVSEAFSGKTLIQRHRAVYAALDTLMETDIHALSIVAKAPDD
ncbi:MAG: BolA family protein [Gammaproteobacteria bacterium]